MKVNIKEALKNRKTDSEFQAGAATIEQAIREGKIKLADVSLRNIAEACLGEKGMDFLQNLNGHEGGMLVGSLREAVSPVMLNSFSNITGLLVLKGAYEAYTSPEFIGSQLVTEETDNEDNVRIPGIADIDDDALEIAEGQEYPTMKFGEDYIQVPGSKKRGGRIALTREMVFFDKTGRLGELSTKLGNRIGTNKEVRILRTVLGVDNTFERKGVTRNTYVSSSDPRINAVSSNALVDYTDIEAVEQLFANYTDDRTTGEPITVMPDTLLCGPNLEWTARRIANATEVRVTASSIETRSANPAGGKFKIIASPWVTWVLINKGSVASNTAKARWFYGNFKKAFKYRTLFAFQLQQASAMHDDEFDRDVIVQWKAGERGVPYVYAPWYAAQSDG